MDAWLDRARAVLARESGVPPAALELDEATRATLLDVARAAAHESGDRRNAPLVCFLLGVASHGGDLTELAKALRLL